VASLSWLQELIVKYIQVFGVCKENDLIGFPVEDVGSTGDQVVYFPHCNVY